MKKIIAIIIICLSVINLVACSNKKTSSENQEQVKITVWHYYNGTTKDAFDTLVQEFNETVGKEKNILVDAYSYSGVNELADATLDSANKEVGAADMPDIFAAYSDNAYNLDKLGVVASLDSYFTVDETNEFYQDFLNEGRFDAENGLKIIPVAKSTEILYINSTDFNKFAAATGSSLNEMSTWEGLSKLSEKYYAWTDSKTKTINDGKALFGMDSIANFFIVSAKQLGVDVFNQQNGEVSLNFNAETAKKLWDVYYKSFVSGHFAAAGRFRSDDIKSGDVIAYAGSTASADYFPSKIEVKKDESYDIECETLPYPHFEGSSKVAIQQGAGMVVSKSTEIREKASVEFLKWFTDTDQNTRFAVSTGYIPVKKEAVENDKIIKYIEDQANVKPSVLKTARVVYGTIEEFMHYSNKPFTGSFDARKILESSITNKIKKDIETLNSAIGEGKDRKDILNKLCSQENFEEWYNDFCAKMQDVMK